MADTIKLNLEKYQQADWLVNELLQERYQVWSLFCRVAELKPFSSSQRVKSKLNEFSDLLIDYISLGHFGIYRRILENQECRKQELAEAEAMYSQFIKTTEVAVSFNDKYEHAENEKWVDNLEQDLSSLGESLARRIDMEDQLCQMISH